MKDSDIEKLRRSQPVPGAELDRRLLERAKKLTEGRKTFGSDAPSAAFSVTNAKEDNRMDKNTHISEVKSRKPAAFAAAAAVLALAVGGGVYASKYRSSDLETSPVMSQTTESETQTQTDSSPTEGDYYAVEGKTAKAWAEPYLAQNDQTIGYVSIPNMENRDGSKSVDLPVVRGEDNEYYLTHGFDKSENQTGCIFTDAGTDIDTDGGQPNIVQLYGKYSTWVNSDVTDDGRIVFEDEDIPSDGKYSADLSYLNAYLDANNVRYAPIIEYKSVWQDSGEYAIFGILLSSGGSLGIDTETVGDYKEWTDWVRENSSFSCNMDCGADDKYIVLSAHDGGNTAIRVFAKKLDEDDDKQKIISSYRVNSNEGEREGKAADLKLELPVNMRGMYTIEVYIDDERVFDYAHDPIGNHEGTVSFPVYGEGQKQAVVYIIDPLSSDLTKGKIEYARFDVDFDSNKVTQVGKYDTEGAQALVDKYAREVELEYLMPGGVDGAFFEVCVDGDLIDTFRYDEFDEKVAAEDRKLKYTAWYPGTKECRVTLYTDLDNHRFEYASYLVDFLNGTYKYAEGGEEKAGMLKAYTQGKARCVFIEIPVPEGYDKNVTFEAYYEDIHMGTAEYTKKLVMPDPFGIALIEDGVDRISINAVFEDKTVKDYMVMDVDFDSGTYKFTKNGEPQLGLFDSIKDE